MKKKYFFLFLFLCPLGITKAQNIVNIPDSRFKDYLVADSSINTNGDSEIQVAEAEAFTGEIDITYKFFSDLTGLEVFKNLTSLNCTGNSYTNLDVSFNKALTELYCDKNNLRKLDVSYNTSLTYLKCDNNKLNSLVGLPQSETLTELYCNNNNLRSLDVSKNTALTHLKCDNNSLAFYSATFHIQIRCK